MFYFMKRHRVKFHPTTYYLWGKDIKWCDDTFGTLKFGYKYIVEMDRLRCIEFAFMYKKDLAWFLLTSMNEPCP